MGDIRIGCPCLEGDKVPLSASIPPPPPTPKDNSAGMAKSLALDARVRSLKIAKSDRIGQRTSANWFPWTLAIAMTGLCLWLLSRDQQLMTQFGFAKSDSASLAPQSPTNSTNSNEPRRLTNVSEDRTGKVAAKPKESTETANPNAPGGADRIALESRGYVIAKHQVLVSPQVSGRIMSLNIEEGRRVKKGDILAEVEPTEYKADYDQMRAILMRSNAELLELETGARPQEIAAATADLQEQVAVITQFESQYNRMKEALKTNSISMSEFEQAQSSFYSSKQRIEKLQQSLSMMKEGPRKERIEMARAAVVQAEANLTKSEWRLNNCTIRAPISGTILKKNAEEGNLVNPIAFNGSFSVCDIADLSDLEIELNIQERDVSKVFVNQTCEVRSEAFPARVYKATVSRLMPIADRAKGAIPVRVRVRVPDEEQGVYLKPEMSAIVVFYGAVPSQD